MNGSKGGLARRVLGALVAVLGLALAIYAHSIVFPVGCNVSYSCAADPVGTWSTWWPNVLTFCLGIVLVAFGLGQARSRKFPPGPLGFALILDGAALLTMGFITGYATSCLGFGPCLGPTGSAWWDFYWPNVVVVSLGASLVVLGGVMVRIARRKDLVPSSNVRTPVKMGRT